MGLGNKSMLKQDKRRKIYNPVRDDEKTNQTRSLVCCRTFKVWPWVKYHAFRESRKWLAKTNKHIQAKRTQTDQHHMLVRLWGGNKSARGEWERVRRWLCLQSLGSWLVGPGSPNGHRFWGLRVSGLFEKDLWSRIKVIYLRTEDHEGLWSLKQGERYRAPEEESGGTEEGARGERGEEELCVMSVFPCLSYFEMWLNGPPSVRPVSGSRAARSPPRVPETDRNYKCTACWNIQIIFPLINPFEKCTSKWLART